MLKRIIHLLFNNKKNFVILFFIFFLFFFSYWVKYTFGSEINYVELIYNLYIKLTGIQDLPQSYKINFILYAINIPIFLSTILLIIIDKYKRSFFYKNNQLIKITSNKILQIFFFNYKIYLIYSILFFLTHFKFYDYMIGLLKYEANSNLYFHTKNIKFIDPNLKKNLILIYFESLEYDIKNLNVKNDKNPLIDIDSIKGKNIYNFKQAPATAISIAGIFASQCSIPFYPTISTNLENLNRDKIICLSDVLDQFDYQQYHFMTVDKTFHRSDLFLENHHYSIYDNQKIREKFPYTEISWGDGVFDDIMLTLAKEKIIKLHNSKKLFNVVIKTTDTHPPFIISPRCKTLNPYYTKQEAYEVYKSSNESDNKKRAFEAYRCSSNFIKIFIEDLEKEGILKNTTLVILGDHLAHKKYDFINKDFHDRNLYFKVNTNKNFTRKLMNHFDVAPTILDELGILPKDNPRFGFGVSLFNNDVNSSYDRHYKSVMNKNILSDFYLKQLFKDKH